MSKINWNSVKQEYIADVTTSYEKLAKKYGISTQAVAERGGREGWTKLKRLALLKIEEKLIEKTSETVAEFQARKFRQGKFVSGKGLAGIATHFPRSAREAKELFESGMKVQTEAMGLDKPNTQINIQNNQYVSLADFVTDLVNSEL